MNEFDAMQLLLAFNDVFFSGFTPPRKNTEMSFQGHHTVITWRQDPDRPPGWFRVKREFL